MRHTVSIDHQPGDRLDTAAWAAFCDTDGCTWRGDWQHADPADPSDEDSVRQAELDAELDAQADGAEHIEDTEAVQSGLLVGTASDGAPVTIAAIYRS